MAGALGCGKPSPFAEGAGYGLGIPRTAFELGRPPQTYGQTTASLVSSEDLDSRPKAPRVWPATGGSRLPLTWAQYRGSPSKR
jgi:hypothetical protein